MLNLDRPPCSICDSPHHGMGAHASLERAYSEMWGVPSRIIAADLDGEPIRLAYGLQDDESMVLEISGAPDALRRLLEALRAARPSINLTPP